MVNYERAIRKPFTDLVKLAIGAIVSVIPVVNLVSAGYALESSGLGKAKASKKMPEWKNIWDLFVKGLASSVIGFVYAIPAIIVFMVGAGFAVASMLNAYLGAVVPQEMLSSVIAGDSSPELVSQLVSQNWYLALPTLVALAPVLLIGGVLAVLAQYMAPVAVLSYLKNRSFSKAFDIGAVSRKAFTMQYLKVWVVAAIVGIVVASLLDLIPVVGASVGVFVSGVMTYSMFGDFYRETGGKR